MIFRGNERPKSMSPEARDRLAAIVEQYLADADDSTRRIVTAVAGLLAKIAYADGRLDKYEDALVLKISDLLHVSRGKVMQLKHDAGNSN